MSYFPLDRDLLSSSLWAQGTPEQIKVWIYLLLAANPRTGRVEDSDPGIALRCALPVDVVTTALEALAAPDRHSRTRIHAGRRIRRLPDGGVELLNYISRRDKDFSTPRWRRWKDRQLANALANGQTPLPTTDTDTDTTTTASKNNLEEKTAANAAATRSGGQGLKAAATAVVFLESFNRVFARKVSITPKIRERIASRLREGYRAEQLIALPILVAASDLPSGLRRTIGPDVLLRDGRHPRTTRDGSTAGATDWLERELGRADRASIPLPLVAIAEQLGVAGSLRDLGATLAEPETPAQIRDAEPGPVRPGDVERRLREIQARDRRGEDA